jgi:hypothetical protein
MGYLVRPQFEEVTPECTDELVLAWVIVPLEELREEAIIAADSCPNRSLILA